MVPFDPNQYILQFKSNTTLPNAVAPTWLTGKRFLLKN